MLDECIEANAVCTHPLVPIAVTAHEDKHIRMWDLSRYSSAVELQLIEFLVVSWCTPAALTLMLFLQSLLIRLDLIFLLAAMTPQLGKFSGLFRFSAHIRAFGQLSAKFRIILSDSNRFEANFGRKSRKALPE